MYTFATRTYQKSFKYIFALLLLLAGPCEVLAQAKSQKLLGLELALNRNLLQDALVSPFRYKGSRLQATALRYESRTATVWFQLGISRSSITMTRDDDGTQVSREQLTTSNFALHFAIYRLLSSVEAKTQWFAGLSNQVQGSISNLGVPIFGANISNSDSYQLAFGNLAINVLLKHSLSEQHVLTGQAGYTLLYFGARQPSLTVETGLSDLPYFWSLPGDYQQLVLSLHDEITLGSHWQLRPGYSLNYIRYRKPTRLTQLHQSFTLGLYYLI